MMFKTILRTTLAAVLALTLGAAPAVAAVPDRQDDDRASWMMDLRSLVEHFYSAMLSGGAATVQEEGETPLPPGESESCEACSDTSPDLDPDG